MKTFFVILAALLLILGYTLLGLGTVISVAYGLHSWAVVDVAFKLALWTTFITWIKVIVAGLLSLLAGSVITVSLR
jgi:hypothetical protein